MMGTMQAAPLWKIVAVYEDEDGAKLRPDEELLPRSFAECEALAARLKTLPGWSGADLQVVPHASPNCPSCGGLLPRHLPRCAAFAEELSQDWMSR